MSGQPQDLGEPPERRCNVDGCMDDCMDELLERTGDIADGHRVEGWALVVSTVGHRDDGSEIRRTVRYAPTTATRGESEHLLSKGAAMVRAAQTHSYQG